MPLPKRVSWWLLLVASPALAADSAPVVVRDQLVERLRGALRSCDVEGFSAPRKWLRKGRPDPDVLLTRHLHTLVDLRFLELHPTAVPLPPNTSLDDLGRMMFEGPRGGPPGRTAMLEQLGARSPRLLPGQLASGGEPSLGFDPAAREHYRLRMECGSLIAGFLDAQVRAGVPLPTEQVDVVARRALQRSFDSHAAVSVIGGTAASWLAPTLDAVARVGLVPSDPHQFAPLAEVWTAYADPAFAAVDHWVLSRFDGLVVHTEQIRDLSATTEASVRGGSQIGLGVFSGSAATGISWQSSRGAVTSGGTVELYAFGEPAFVPVPSARRILEVWERIPTAEPRYADGDTAMRVSRGLPGRAWLEFGPVTPALCSNVDLAAVPTGFADAALLGAPTTASRVFEGETCRVELTVPMAASVPAAYGARRHVSGAFDVTLALDTSGPVTVDGVHRRLSRTYRVKFQAALDPVPQVVGVTRSGGDGRPHRWEIAFGASAPGVVAVEVRRDERVVATPAECADRLDAIVTRELDAWEATWRTSGIGSVGSLVVPGTDPAGRPFPVDFPATCTLLVPVDLHTESVDSPRSNPATLSARLELPRETASRTAWVEIPADSEIELAGWLDPGAGTTLGVPLREIVQLLPPDPDAPRSTDGWYIADAVARSAFVAGILRIGFDAANGVYLVPGELIDPRWGALLRQRLD